MNKFETLIAKWRTAWLAQPGMNRDTLTELENHLREAMTRMIRSGMSQEAAFQRAVAQLGSAPVISAEFQKLDASGWLPVKVVAGIGIVLAMAMAGLMITHPTSQHMGWLLMTHTFTLTFGYVTALLGGVLGICFVCQRSVLPFTEARQEWLVRMSFRFGCVAAGLTAAGIILGELWSGNVRGHLWSSNPKAMASFGLLAWQIGFLLAHGWRWISSRTVLLLSIPGNIIVSVAWLGPFLLVSPHNFGTTFYFPFLLVFIAIHLGFGLAGLAPAGWLRSERLAGKGR